jgi:pyruvate kinase
VSLPDTLLAVGALTEKDMSDLHQALEVEADWIALSFVQRPEDIIDVRKIVQGRAGVMAKIEKPQAVERLEEIIKLCDAFMIARGDLGVELPLETVPGLQKRMIRIARRFGKPVVVATQMLESMITSPVPTRAEVSDVSIAVFEGADAIMLSAESASGQYPVEAVAMMNKVRAGDRARSDRGRRHFRGNPAGCRDARPRRDRDLHVVRIDGDPRRP